MGFSEKVALCCSAFADDRTFKRRRARKGSAISEWLSHDGAEKCGTSAAGGMYNAMIAPLTPLPLSGFVWYQGEADVNRAAW